MISTEDLENAREKKIHCVLERSNSGPLVRPKGTEDTILLGNIHLG
jgi:hypothetical protein